MMSSSKQDNNNNNNNDAAHPPTPTSSSDAYYERLFNSLDMNNDGRISLSDLSCALRKDGRIKSDAHRLSLIRSFLSSSDADMSGDVSLEEFTNYARKHEKKLKIIFTNIDLNRDGKIDLDEVLKSMKEQLGVQFADEKSLKDMFERLGAVGSGDKGTLEISWEDWRDYLILNPTVESMSDVLKFWRHSTYMDIGEDTSIPDDFTAAEMQSGMWWRHLLAGAVAGAVSRTSTAPLDRIKVFLQVHGKSSGSLLTCFRGMLKEGGVLSLWRGNGINVLKIAPESALKFMAYEQGKRLLKGTSQAELRIEERFLAGSLAGAFSQSVIYPLEVVKTRLALRRTGQYSSLLDLILKMYRGEGLRVFYRGYVPNLLGILPYAGIDLAVYETLKKNYIKSNPSATSSENSSQNPGVLVLLACGTASSACGQVASYPLALVRTRLQASVVTATAAASSYSMVNLFRDIYATEGVVGLYRGLMPNFLKVAPAVSISYVVYEHVRQQLGVTMT